MIDDEIVAECRKGSEPAFRTLYYRTAPRVRAWVARFLGPSPQVADVVQEVFVQVHRSIASFRGDSAFGTWLHRLTLNVVTSHLRHAGRDERHRDPRTPGDVGSYDEEGRILARAELLRLYEALDTLSVDKRIVFVLFEVEGMTLREIADLMATGVPTVAARLRRARLALVESFGRPIAERRVEGMEE